MFKRMQRKLSMFKDDGTLLLKRHNYGIWAHGCLVKVGYPAQIARVKGALQ
jgi:hypothetical protein